MIEAIPDAALAECVAIVGRTGAGKSYTSRGLVERVLDRGERVCLIDPTGVAWGLRLIADGTSPSRYPVVIFGGEHADIAIHDHAGAAVARIVADHQTPTIVDVSEFTIGARTRFMAEFFDALYRANRREPLTLVIDEADAFAPQRAMPDQTVMFSRLEQIVRRGRVRGFRPWLITQRPAELHKSVLSQAGTLIALKLTAPQDRKAIEGWVQGHADKAQAREVLGSLAGLDRGEGWVWCPAADMLRRMRFDPIRTFDSMRTPERGEAAVTLAPLDRRQIAGISEEIAGLEAEAKANDPKSLKARIAELERQLAARPSAAPDGEAIAQAMSVARRDTIEEAHRSISEGMQKFRAAVSAALETLAGTPFFTRSAASAGGSIPGVGAGVAAARSPQGSPRDPSPHAQTTEGRRNARGSASHRSRGDLHPAAVKMLAAIAREAPRGTVTWNQVATLAGIWSGNGHFYGGKKDLIDHVLVADNGGHPVISPAGHRLAGRQDQPMKRAELVALWSARLREPAPKMLEHLAGADAAGVGVSELAEAIGTKPGNGHWYGGLAALRKAGLIEQSGSKGVIRPSALLMSL